MEFIRVHFMSETNRSSFIKAGLIISTGIFLGRLMGFARDLCLMHVFGVSSNSDIAILALTIPDILVSLLVAGGLSVALIPEFKSLSKKNSFILFSQTSILIVYIFSFLVFCLSYNSSVLVGIFAPGLNSEAFLKAQSIIAGVIWLIPLTVLSGVTTAYLQANNKFAMPAMGTGYSCEREHLFLPIVNI